MSSIGQQDSATACHWRGLCCRVRELDAIGAKLAAGFAHSLAAWGLGQARGLSSGVL